MNNDTTNIWTSENIHCKISCWDELKAGVHKEPFYSWWGHSTEPIPSFHFDNMKQIIEENRVLDFQYPESYKGFNKLLLSIGENFNEYFGKEINSLKEVLISLGAMQGILNGIKTFLRPGDEVVVFEPYFPFYFGVITSIPGVKIKAVRLNIYKEGVTFNIDDFKNAISSKTRILIINNPHNPSTKMFSKDEYEMMSDILNDYPNVMVLEDATYSPYVNALDKKLLFFANIGNNFERSVTVFSSGKIFNVAGLRVGIVIASETNIRLMYETYRYEFVYAPIYEQNVISLDLKVAIDNDYYNEVKKRISDKVKLIESFFNELDIGIIPLYSESTHYVNFNIQNLKDKIPIVFFNRWDNNEYCQSIDKAFCRWLGNEYSIGFLPLSSLYLNESPPENLVRLSINKNDSDIEFLFNQFKKLKLLLK